MYYLCIQGNNQCIRDGLHPERASHAEESIRPCKYHAKEKKRQESWLNIFNKYPQVHGENSHLRLVAVLPRREACDTLEVFAEKGLRVEMQVQGYLLHRIEQYLNSKGRKIIGWDEIL